MRSGPERSSAIAARHADVRQVVKLSTLDVRTLVITGSKALSYGEMAAILGRTIGKRVGFEELSDEEAYARTVV